MQTGQRDSQNFVLKYLELPLKATHLFHNIMFHELSEDANADTQQRYFYRKEVNTVWGWGMAS